MDARWQQYYWNHYLHQQQQHQQLTNQDTTVSPPTATHHTYNPTGTYGPLTQPTTLTHTRHHHTHRHRSTHRHSRLHRRSRSSHLHRHHHCPQPTQSLHRHRATSAARHRHQLPAPALHLPHRHLTSLLPLHQSTTLGTKPNTIGIPTPSTATSSTAQSNPHNGLEKQGWQGFQPLTSSRGNWRTMVRPNSQPALLATENSLVLLPPEALRSLFSLPTYSKSSARNASTWTASPRPSTQNKEPTSPARQPRPGLSTPPSSTYSSNNSNPTLRHQQRA